MSSLKEELQRLKSNPDTDSSTQIISSWISNANSDQANRDLRQLCVAIIEFEVQYLLDPMHVVPELLSSCRAGAEDMLALVANHGNVKEVAIALQEYMEYLQQIYNDGDEEQEQQPGLVSPPITLCRIVSLFAIVVSRTQVKRRTAAETLKSTIRGLDITIESASSSVSVEEGRMILDSIANLVTHAAQWLSKDISPENDTGDGLAILEELLELSLTCLEPIIQASLAQRRFQEWYPRLASRMVLAPNWERGSKAIDAVQDAYTLIEKMHQNPMRKPSVMTLVLSAHSSVFVAQEHVSLQGYINLITACLKVNTALDAALAFMILCISSTNVPVLEPSATYNLCHVIAMTAAVHHDSIVRLIAWRTLKAIVEKLPPQEQLRFLQELCAHDSPVPSQLRIAAIGLAKDMISSAVAQSSPCILASPRMLQALGPLILCTDPPDLFERLTKAPLHEFIDTPEPKRLIEVLGFYYVISSRDSSNKTGINDRDNQVMVHKSLFHPLQTRLVQWQEISPDHEADHEASFILSALQIGLDRVLSIHP